MSQRFRAIDSHTGGEPTRLVFGESLGLLGSTMTELRADFAARFDGLRSGLVCEPRGSDVLVGALLVPGFRAEHGVIFFNNVGMLGMCGHGTIGIARTLLELGIWSPGIQKLDTPVGVVEVDVASDGTTTFQNVECFLHEENVEVEVDGHRVSGDITWGGNGFFLCEDHGLAIEPANLGALLDLTSKVQKAMVAYGEVEGQLVDHVELIGPPTDVASARNFVLCPGGAYDRSPCGTGTSAKVAALAAKGKLAPGERWRQQSITGSVFEAWYEEPGPTIRPFIRGIAHVTAHLELVFDESDPLRDGYSGGRV